MPPHREKRGPYNGVLIMGERCVVAMMIEKAPVIGEKTVAMMMGRYYGREIGHYHERRV